MYYLSFSKCFLMQYMYTDPGLSFQNEGLFANKNLYTKNLSDLSYQTSLF